MIKTLYVRNSDADRCTESFQAGIPITVTGIDAAVVPMARRSCVGPPVFRQGQ
jgi:hypothetical protein